ncbi:MAG TPA: hypothetical protein VHX42_00820 [Candidatus Babeliales bacterium]|jgi:hypothetical protein|nr:hypothetical protein [Candidatus Babeliales bacterium]
MNQSELTLTLQDFRTFGADVQKNCITSAQNTNSLFEQEHTKQKHQFLGLKPAEKQIICSQSPIKIEQPKRFKKSAQQQEDTIINLTSIFEDNTKKSTLVKEINFADKFQGINEELYYLASALDANINKSDGRREFYYLLKAEDAHKKNKPKLNFHDLSHALDASGKNDIKLPHLGGFRIPLELENQNDYTKYIAGYTHMRDKTSPRYNINNNKSIDNHKNIFGSPSQIKLTPDQIKVSHCILKASYDSSNIKETQTSEIKPKKEENKTSVKNPHVEQLGDEPDNFKCGKCLQVTTFVGLGTVGITYILAKLGY